MATLSELISQSCAPEAKDNINPNIESLSAEIPGKKEKPHAQYEVEVFNYLFANKDLLAIKSVMRFKALLMDGAVELMDGKPRAGFLRMDGIIGTGDIRRLRASAYICCAYPTETSRVFHTPKRRLKSKRASSTIAQE